MEKENRVLGGCALFTCLSIPLMLCAVALVFGLGINLNPFAAASHGPSSAPQPVLQRLALIGSDGNVYVVDQQGGSRVAITDDAALDRSAAVRRAYAFPNWSRNGQKLAFVGVSSERNGTAYVYTASASDGKPLEIFMSESIFPFYLSWSPDSQRVAFLASDRNDVSLRYSDADGGTPQVLGTGSPFYFAWSPDSQTMLTHVGGSSRQSADASISLHPLNAQNRAQKLALPPANFLAPSWSPDGNELLVALMGSANTQDSLVVFERSTQRTRTLTNFAGNISFTWSPDGRAIAYIVTRRAGSNIQSELHVIKPDGSDDQLLADDTPLVFFWSPDSRKLAYLVRAIGDQGALLPTGGALQQSSLRLTWKVLALADKQQTTLASFIPTDSFASLLPYFDQYAHSVRLWSPDSQYLVYCADESDGGEGVYVVSAAGGIEAKRIAAGNIAVWSWR